MNFSKWLEAFDSNIGIRWEKSGPSWAGRFRVGKETFQIDITRSGYVGFRNTDGDHYEDVPQPQNVSASLKVLGTIMQGIEQYIQEMQPARLVVSSTDNFGRTEPTRARVYQSMSVRFAPQIARLGYTIENNPSGFVLSRAV